MNWFYSLINPLSAEQIASLSQQFQAFLGQWKSHGTPVSGNIDIKYARFIVISLAENSENPSGCSIDSMRHAVEKILTANHLTWADAANIFYRDDNGDIQATDFRQIAALVKSGELRADTQVFDNSLSNTGDLSKWEVRLGDTWMKRHL